MKETARAVLEQIFLDWCDAIESGDRALMKICFNQFIGAQRVYEEQFNEEVSYYTAREHGRRLMYEERR